MNQNSGKIRSAKTFYKVEDDSARRFRVLPAEKPRNGFQGAAPRSPAVPAYATCVCATALDVAHVRRETEIRLETIIIGNFTGI